MSKRKLVLSCLTLILALILASVNTFAWFTTNSKNNLNNGNFTQPEDGEIEFVLGGKGTDEFSLNPDELITLELKISNTGETDLEINIILEQAEVTLPTIDPTFKYSKSFIDCLSYYKDDSLYDINSLIDFTDEVDDLLEYNDLFAKYVAPVSNCLQSQVFLINPNKADTINEYTANDFFTTNETFNATNLQSLPDSKLYELNKELAINDYGLTDNLKGINMDNEAVSKDASDCIFYLDEFNKLIVKGNTIDASLYLKVYFNPSIYNTFNNVTLKNSNSYLMQQIKASINVELIA